jgi:hypothetical protein
MWSLLLVIALLLPATAIAQNEPLVGKVVGVTDGDTIRFARGDGGQNLVVEDLAPAMGETSCIVCPNKAIPSASGSRRGPEKGDGPAAANG